MESESQNEVEIIVKKQKAASLPVLRSTVMTPKMRAGNKQTSTWKQKKHPITLITHQPTKSCRSFFVVVEGVATRWQQLMVDLVQPLLLLSSIPRHSKEESEQSSPPSFETRMLC
jgi:hypothetical protein